MRRLAVNLDVDDESWRHLHIPDLLWESSLLLLLILNIGVLLVRL